MKVKEALVLVIIKFQVVGGWLADGLIVAGIMLMLMAIGSIVGNILVLAIAVVTIIVVIVDGCGGDI